MEYPIYAILVLVGIGAGFVQRVSGFGLGIFAMIFLPHFMSSHTDAVVIVSIFSCVTSTWNAVRYGTHVAFKTVLPMVCAALISIPLAVRFSAVVPGNIFEILLGAVLIALSLYFMLLNKRIRMKPTVTNGVFAGALSGVLSGLFSTGGPPAVLYLNSATEDNITYFATIQFYFCFTNLYATAVRAANGIIHADLLLLAAVGAIGCMVGDAIGKTVFDKLDSDKLRRVIYGGMLISGIVTLL